MIMKSLMEKIPFLIENFKALWADDFCRGAISALAIIVAVSLLYLILKLLFWLKFRKRRCHEIEIDLPEGKVKISENALTAALRSELAGFSQLDIRKILIYSRKNKYFFVIRTTFSDRDGSTGMPELFAAAKPLLIQRMQELFGVSQLDDITFIVEKFSPKKSSDPADSHSEKAPASDIQVI